MSHRKVHSQGNVPFSWEDKPGVSKVIHQKCPTDIELYARNLPPPTSPPCRSDSPKVSSHNIKIPLPPCPLFQPPPRSNSLKGLWRQEDPFLAAYKECTKNVIRNGKMASESKKAVVGFGLIRKNKFMSSCKQSCDVRDDNLVRLSHLPPLPRERIRELR